MDNIKVTNNLGVINRFLELLKSKKLTVEELNLHVHNYLVYEKDNEIVGFIGYSVYYDRSEIDYLYVLEEYRNMDIAKSLLNYVIQKCKNKCINITLEVNENNFIAIELYKKMGFREIKIIDNYYKNENGLLMIKEFD